MLQHHYQLDVFFHWLNCFFPSLWMKNGRSSGSELSCSSVNFSTFQHLTTEKAFYSIVICRVKTRATNEGTKSQLFPVKKTKQKLKINSMTPSPFIQVQHYKFLSQLPFSVGLSTVEVHIHDIKRHTYIFFLFVLGHFELAKLFQYPKYHNNERHDMSDLIINV